MTSYLSQRNFHTGLEGEMYVAITVMCVYYCVDEELVYLRKRRKLPGKIW